MLGHVDLNTQDVLKKARADAGPVSFQALQRKKWSSTMFKVNSESGGASEWGHD